MDALGIAVIAICGLLTVYAWVSLPKAWRGDDAEQHLRAVGLATSNTRGARATRRNSVLLAIVATLISFGGSVAIIVGDDDMGQPLETIWLAAVAAAVLAGMLMVPVWLFNWPKFVVPPPYRSEPGALVERFHNRATGDQEDSPRDNEEKDT